MQRAPIPPDHPYKPPIWVQNHPSKAVRQGPHGSNPLLNDITWKLNGHFVKTQRQDTLPTLEYSTLSGSRTIRLVILHAALCFGSPLVCDMVDVALDGQRFEALSYVWGSTEEPLPIQCNGAKTLITENLDAALRYPRHKTTRRKLWVDALCIDQADLSEKESQLPLMRDIYTQAERTVIWVGSANLELVLQIGVLRMTQPLMLFLNYLLTHGKKRFWINPLANALSSERSLAIDYGIHEFFDLDWFSRTWTIQELLLNARSTFVCGRHSFRAKLIANHVRFLLPWYDLDVDMTKARRNYHRPQGQILLKSFNKHTNSQDQIVGLQVMMAIKSAHSTNPKDKVIGVQAIVQQIGLTLPLLTYAMGESELFTILTTYWMSHWSSLQLLSLTATSAIADDVPTWVVRWDECEQESGNMITGRYSRLVYLQAMNSVINQETSATSKYPMPAHTLHRSLTSRELVLQGWVLTTIRTFVLPSGVSQRSMLGSESAQEVERERTTSLARTVRTNIRWASFLITLCGEKNVKAAMHAFASIMNIGPEQLVSFGYQTSNLLYRDLQFMANFSEHLTENDQDLLQKFIAKSRDHLNNDHQDLLEGLGSIDQRSIWPILRARTEVETLFTTADGRLGLCYSRPIQQGDSIVLVAGSDFPLIVRPSPSDADKYVFLGPAVVSGPCDDATMEKDRARGRDPRTPRMVALADDMYRKWYRKPGHEFAAIGSLMRGDEWLANASIGTMSEFVLV